MKRTIELDNQDLTKLAKTGVSMPCYDTYLLDKNTIIKIFNRETPLSSEEHISSLTGIRSDIFLFPKKLVYVDGLYKGYSYSSTTGEELFRVNDETKLEDIELSSKEVTEEATSLSSRKLYITTLNDRKIFIGDGIQITDTDTYCYNKRYSVEDAAKSNRAQVLDAIYDSLYPIGMIMGISNKPNDLVDIYYQMLEAKEVDLKRYLELSREALVNATGKNIETIGDLNDAKQTLSLKNPSMF